MGVIITGMEIPESCYYCPLASGGWKKDEGAWCDARGERLSAGSNARDCPLKSVDGLIEQIEEMGGHVHDSNYWNGVYDAIEIIKNYCKEEEKP